MQSSRGFSLIEVLVATTIMAVGMTGLAQLFVVAIGSNERAKDTTRATVCALQKMEELRAGPALASSPPDALDRNAPGYYDVIAGGMPLVRRWSVESLPADPERTFVLQVRVLDSRRGAGVHLTSITRRGP